ncbi:Chromate transport protein [compost metagenome]
MRKNINTYITLFTSTFYLSTVTFGGGFVIIPLMKKKFSDDLKWIEKDELLNLVAIAQSAPGSVAVNSSILIGYRVCGVLGALITILGTVLPPLIILSTISLFYKSFSQNVIVSTILDGMQAGVAAVIIDVVINMGQDIFKEKENLSILLMIITFILSHFFKISVIYLLIICIAIGALKTYLNTKRREKK